MNICDVGHRGKAAWRPGLETGALLSNAPSPSPEPLRVRGLEGSQGRFDLTDKTYLEQPPILAGQGSQSQSPGYLPTRVLAELWIAPRDPLYLFVCSMLWHAEADVGAGWELVGGLRSRAGRAYCLGGASGRSEEHTSELQSLRHLVCRLLR